ncbi:transcription factor IIIB 50 kDa subunit-like [Oppia nitens]|uniref:transcription factor IIIB 50 kDa subunit-like n=1 Tax=Oppia nitens TaxID=1686743 RepID=UPI0023DA6707|nr:transcription factor IIIB 50 kDa subunit-like [Oppia nitens]
MSESLLRYGGCGNCGSELDNESGHIVCTGCGRADDSGLELAADHNQPTFANDSHRFANQSMNASVRYELYAHVMQNNGLTHARQHGMKIAETLADHYYFTNDMKEYLKRYYSKAWNHKNFLRCSLRTKQILAAVCAYVTLMINDHPIAIHYMCSGLPIPCNVFDFNKIYKVFVEVFPECKPITKPIEELVPSVLKEMGIIKIVENDIDSHEDKALIKRVMDIVSIEKACWLVEGRSPLYVITAATYLGWKSLKPLERMNFKFAHFCKKFMIRSSVTIVDRVKEQNDIFIKLAKNIPMVKLKSTRVHRNNVALFVDDIIQYSNSLIFDLRAEIYNKLNDRQQQQPKSITTETIPQEDNYSDDNDKQWMNNFKRKVYYHRSGLKNSDSNQVFVREEEEENEEPDISDTEIDKYLRSDAEIKCIKKLHKKMRKLEELDKN